MSKIYSNLHIEGQLIYNNNPQDGYVLTTDSSGLVSWTSSTAVFPTASNTDLGYLKVGQSLTINNMGVAEVATASSENIGGVIVGSGLTVSNAGVLSLSGGGDYLPLSGGTMSGDIQLDGNKIIGANANNYLQMSLGYQYLYYEYGVNKSTLISNGGFETKGGLSDDTIYGDLVLNNTNSVFRYTKDGVSTSLNLSASFSSGGGTASGYFEDSINNVGIVYADDYSSNFVDNSLVTKKYVDSVSGGTTYTTGIGLTLSGSTFSLSTTNYKTIYVSATGSDSNNGLSPITPVLNLWKARDLAVSGDTVMVMPGSYIFDNRNSAGCPYNGLVESKVNLWKDGVSYNFMPGAKIYSYGSTSVSYSPYSDNMIFFQPNSLTFSTCTITGDLEFYATSEGGDNSGGGSFLFIGEENLGSYPGYTFYLNAKHIEGVTGCTLLRAIRSSVGAGTASIYIDVKTLKYGYTTGQSSNAGFTAWRGGDNCEMDVNIKVGRVIGSGTSWYPVFGVRPYSTSGINKLRVNIDIEYASMLGYSYLLNFSAANTSSLISSGHLNFNCNSCVFSPSLFNLLQTYKNYYITISGNYYCSGVVTGKSSFFPSTYPFIALWDQTNDSVTDNTVLDFKGNYYANYPTRTMVHVGSYGTGNPLFYGYTNNIGNVTGDIYFAGTSSNYTGTLFYVDMGILRYSGRIHGTTNYSGYGFGGSVLSFGNHISSVVISNAYIHSNLNSNLVSYVNAVGGQSTLTLMNSSIDMMGTSSVIADLRNVNTYLQNSTVRNRGTDYIFSNTLSTGSLQITNSTLINSSSTASTINYPLGTVIGAGAFSNKDIIFSTLSGTVSVVSGLI